VRILGFDLGERHLGVALWDDPELPARPLETVSVTSSTLVDAIVHVIDREKADEVVIGLPLRLDGREGLASRHARRVAKAISARVKIPVHLEDERLTTAQAHTHRVMAGKKGREGIDARAAAILLQTFVDRRSAAAWQRDEDDA
jgi:putative Holliday junction resolvase